MDLKGISWVGNMYQKFEAMCVEVEETLYEDTVQYVENQATTVGTCLKKFYADIMQDLLLESCVDPMKTESPGQGLPQYDDVGTYERPKAVVKKEPIKFKKAVRKNPVSSHVERQMDNGFFFEQTAKDKLCKPLPKDAAEDKWADWNWEQNESDPGFRVNLRRKFPSSEISRQTTTVTGESEVTSRDTELHVVDEAKETEALASNLASLCEGRGITCQEDANTNGNAGLMPSDFPLLNMNLNESGNEGIGLVDPQYGHSQSELDVVKSLDMKRSTDQNMQNEEAPTLPDTGTLKHLNEIKNDESVDLRMNVTGMLDCMNLEESCVLVDKNEECSISHSPSKRRSYKKKIRDAFSPRKWSKNKEYGQLDGDRGKSLLAISETKSGESNLESLDSCESEWELL